MVVKRKKCFPTRYAKFILDDIIGIVRKEIVEKVT